MKYLNIFIILSSIFILILANNVYSDNEKLKEEISVLEANQKAFISDNSSLSEENRLFKFTVDQLNYYNDSIIQKLNSVRKKLNIKDKDIKSLQYITSLSTRTDTIELRDTVFKENIIEIDTVFGDKWYKANLKLKYPNKIILSPEFKSEKYIIASYRKETIKPPNKYWLFRLFQKKHKVVRVEVVEKCPYIINGQQKFIEIIK